MARPVWGVDLHVPGPGGSVAERKPAVTVLSEPVSETLSEAHSTQRPR